MKCGLSGFRKGALTPEVCAETKVALLLSPQPRTLQWAAGGKLLMPRNRQRACLESGLKLDLNRLIKRGIFQPGLNSGTRLLSWSNSHTGEFVASVSITAEFHDHGLGAIQLAGGHLEQRIALSSCRRHFGGYQWYFICPRTARRCSVLWMPPGARFFASRQAWRRQVAYASQFETRIGRAHRGKAKINSRLCAISGLDSEEWEFPPKPKWMRWDTYNRAERKFDRYEDILDEGTLELVVKFMSHGV